MKWTVHRWYLASGSIEFTVATSPAHFCETLERLQPIASAMSCCVKPLKASKRLISSPVVISGLVCLVTLTSYI
jgi:hypothetical protein